MDLVGQLVQVLLLYLKCVSISLPSGLKQLANTSSLAPRRTLSEKRDLSYTY